jgi:hypothetical protein
MVGCLVLVAVGPASAAPVGTAAPAQFAKVSAHTAGEELEIDFVERGLTPGQNYAYVGSSSKVIETFQCYRSDTFTPLPHKFQVTTLNTSPDVRGYTADANGVVKGFVFVEGVFGTVRGCEGPNREAVLIHVTYTNFDLVDIFTVAYVAVTGRFSGPVEPD